MNPPEALTAALGHLLEQGQRPPCAGGGDVWLSDDLDERSQAAHACDGCPLLAPCDAVGQGEKFGVWAGIDRTTTNKRKAA